MNGVHCQWVPFRRELMRVAHENRMALDSSLEHCRDRVRPLHKELKAKGHKVTLKDLSSNLQSAVWWLKFLRQDRAKRRELAPNYNLEERIIRRLYRPHEPLIRRTLLAAGRDNVKLSIKRGEPDVEYISHTTGYGWGEHTNYYLTVTLPRGWPKLAEAGKAEIPCIDGQFQNLVVDWKPEWQKDDLFAAEHPFRTGQATIVLRKKAAFKLITRTAGEHAGIWVTGDSLKNVLDKLPKKVAATVASKLN